LEECGLINLDLGDTFTSDIIQKNSSQTSGTKNEDNYEKKYKILHKSKVVYKPGKARMGRSRTV
jgi:hypothetical protein